MCFELLNGERHDFPVCVSIPHSGTLLPEEMEKLLLQGVVSANTDWFLPELYGFLERRGVTVLIDRYSRYAADVNRDPTRCGVGSYTKSAVYERTTFERPMYAEALTEAQIAARIERCHAPYHAALRRMLDDKLRVFGRAYLFDLHSFMGAYHGDTGADVVLGTAEGRACTPQHTRRVREAFEGQGYTVSCDRPFGGGYITRHYGGGAVEALLVELRYRCYLCDRTFGEEVLRRSDVDEELFAQARERLGNVFETILNGVV